MRFFFEFTFQNTIFFRLRRAHLSDFSKVFTIFGEYTWVYHLLFPTNLSLPVSVYHRSHDNFWYEFIITYNSSLPIWVYHEIRVCWFEFYHKMLVYCFEFTKISIYWFEFTKDLSFRNWVYHKISVYWFQFIIFFNLTSWVYHNIWVYHRFTVYWFEFITKFEFSDLSLPQFSVY